MITHCSDDDLSVYALAPSLSGDAEGVSRHLDECETCRNRLDLIEELDDAFRDPAMWAVVDLTLVRPSRFEEARAEYERIEREDAEAEQLLEPLLKSAIRFRDLQSDDPAFHTGSVVRKLCLAAHSRHEKQPEFSLQIATAACRIALHLPKLGTERRFVLGLAVRERANALRYLGRFTEGLKSLEDAEKLFDQSPGTDPFDLAVVWYIRSTIYVETEHPEEGLQMARASAAVFREYGDQPRELSAVMAEACCIHFLGSPGDAAEAFGRVAAIARAAADSRTLASALQNAGTSYLAAQEHSKAGVHLLEAISIFDELNLATERARSMWKLASVTIAQGDLKEGLTRLEEARSDLEKLGLTNDVALATLEWAEGRLAAGLPEKVAETCRAILVDFKSEGMLRNARIALAYLHEALSSGAATAHTVHQVRTYLEELPSWPEQPFAPDI